MDVMRSGINRGLSGFASGLLDPVILLVVSALDPRPTTDHHLTVARVTNTFSARPQQETRTTSMKRKYEESMSDHSAARNEEGLESRMKCRKTIEHEDAADSEVDKSPQTKGCKTVASGTWVQKLSDEEMTALEKLVKEQQRQWKHVQGFILSVITR
jgi:hypothetical protein